MKSRMSTESSTTSPANRRERLSLNDKKTLETRLPGGFLFAQATSHRTPPMLAWEGVNGATANIEHAEHVRWKRRSRIEEGKGFPSSMPWSQIGRKKIGFCKIQKQFQDFL